VLRAPELSATEALAQGSAEGLRGLTLDTTGVTTKTGVLVAAGRMLGAGDDFGVNLDALYDVLRDIEEPTAIAWSGWSELAEADPTAFEGIVEVFDARSQEAPLSVLLCG